MLKAIHFGHAGRDAVLRDAADVWWPKIHREFVERANNCQLCRSSGKIFKCMKSQNEFRKLPTVEKQNEEIALDFVGSFSNASKGKK